MLFGKPAFQEGARVDARRCVSLVIDKIAGLTVDGRTEEVIKADFAQRSQRGIGGNMAADIGVVLVGPHHHGGGIPSDNTFYTALERTITRIRDFLVYRNRVQKRRRD